jgi:hypothetical protein
VVATEEVVVVVVVGMTGVAALGQPDEMREQINGCCLEQQAQDRASFNAAAQMRAACQSGLLGAVPGDV